MEENLTEEQFASIAKMADELGDQQAAEKLGISIDALLRVLARRPGVRQGTVALLQRNLGRLATK